MSIDPFEVYPTTPGESDFRLLATHNPALQASLADERDIRIAGVSCVDLLI